MAKRWRKNGKRIRNAEGKRARAEACCCPPHLVCGICGDEALPTQMLMTVSGAAAMPSFDAYRLWAELAGFNHVYGQLMHEGDPGGGFTALGLNGTYELPRVADTVDPLICTYEAEYVLHDVEWGLGHWQIKLYGRVRINTSLGLPRISFLARVYSEVLTEDCSSTLQWFNESREDPLHSIQIYERRAGWPADTYASQSDSAGVGCAGSVAVYSLSDTVTFGRPMNGLQELHNSVGIGEPCLEQMTKEAPFDYSPDGVAVADDYYMIFAYPKLQKPATTCNYHTETFSRRGATNCDGGGLSGSTARGTVGNLSPTYLIAGMPTPFSFAGFELDAYGADVTNAKVNFEPD